MMKEELNKSLKKEEITYDFSPVKEHRFCLDYKNELLPEITETEFNNPSFILELWDGQLNLQKTKDIVSFCGKIRLGESKFILVRNSSYNGYKLFLYNEMTTIAYLIFSETYEEPRLKTYLFDNKLISITNDYIDYENSDNDVIHYGVKIIEIDVKGNFTVVHKAEAEEIFKKFIGSDY